MFKGAIPAINNSASLHDTDRKMKVVNRKTNNCYYTFCNGNCDW